MRTMSYADDFFKQKKAEPKRLELYDASIEFAIIVELC